MADKYVNADLHLQKPLAPEYGGLGAKAIQTHGWAFRTVPVRGVDGNFEPKLFTDFAEPMFFGRFKNAIRTVSWGAMSAETQNVSVALGTAQLGGTWCPTVQFWNTRNPLGGTAPSLPQMEIAYHPTQNEIRFMHHTNKVRGVFTVSTTGAVAHLSFTCSGLHTVGQAYVNSTSTSTTGITVTIPQAQRNTATCLQIRCHNTAVSYIAGLAANQTHGRRIVLYNAPNTGGGWHNIVLRHQAVNAAAANRFTLPYGQEYTLRPGAAIEAMYIDDSWKLLGAP